MEFKVDVNIDTNEIERRINRGIDKANDYLTPILEKYAKTNHIYKNRTNNLTNSTVVRDIRKGLELTATASYAGYVAGGHGSWSGDTWLQDAIKDNERLILDTYNEYIRKELL